jgi:hypothetical protein
VNVAGDPYEVPYDAIPEKQRERVRRVLEAPTAMVPLARTEVRSRLEVYEFLLDELPFTAGVLRELKRAKYLIVRSPSKEGMTEAEWRRTYLFDDKEGLQLRAQMVHRDARRSIYYTYGRYDLGIITVSGWSVIITVYEREGGALMTEARVYTLVEGAGVEKVARALKGALEATVRKKAFVFIDAAKAVAEMAAERPGELYNSVLGSDEVEEGTLEEFRGRFLK